VSGSTTMGTFGEVHYVFGFDPEKNGCGRMIDPE
jgi:hypothetical protein